MTNKKSPEVEWAESEARHAKLRRGALLASLLAFLFALAVTAPAVYFGVAALEGVRISEYSVFFFGRALRDLLTLVAPVFVILVPSLIASVVYRRKVSP